MDERNRAKGSDRFSLSERQTEIGCGAVLSAQLGCRWKEDERREQIWMNDLSVPLEPMSRSCRGPLQQRCGSMRAASMPRWTWTAELIPTAIPSQARIGVRCPEPCAGWRPRLPPRSVPCWPRRVVPQEGRRRTESRGGGRCDRTRGRGKRLARALGGEGKDDECALSTVTSLLPHPRNARYLFRASSPARTHRAHPTACPRQPRQRRCPPRRPRSTAAGGWAGRWGRRASERRRA